MGVARRSGAATIRPMICEPERDRADEDDERDYFESYADPGVHRLMIGDHARTDAYRRALEEVVKPGETVLDVGTGSGILALFAARSGAAHVFAVDESAILETARQLARANGLDQRVSFRRGRAEDLALPDRVDLLVSEWMGFFALAECMFLSVVEARDQNLKPGGKMMPSALRLHLVAVDDTSLHTELGVGLWERPVYGLDFKPMLEHELHCLITSTADLAPSAFLGPEALLLELDCARASGQDFFFEQVVTLEIERDGTVHGFGGWFDVDLSPGVTLSTSPWAPATHWRQSFFPVRPFRVRRGDLIELEFSARPKQYGDRRLPLYFIEAEVSRDGVPCHHFFYSYDGSFE